MTDIPRLEPDYLSVVMFGPGFGESIAVRVPPGRWLIVDSLHDSTSASPFNPVIRLLALYEDERPDVVVLTHSHLDHAIGFDNYTDEWPDAVYGCVPAFLPSYRDVSRMNDLEAARRRSAAEHALAAIDNIWGDAESGLRRWELLPGTHQRVGEARVTAHGPPKAAVDAALRKPPRDLNRLSAPLEIRWYNARIILGADLPGTGWKQLERNEPPLLSGAHDAFKVPHHGSHKAIVDAFGNPVGRVRNWTLTPWRLGGRSLPGFDDEYGVDLMLRHVPEVTLTSLPVEANLSSRIVTRAEVQATTAHEHAGDFVLTYEPTDPGTAAAWVLRSYDRDGACVVTVEGESAVTITP